MIKLVELMNEIELQDVEFVSPEETDIDYYDDLNRIEIESGIYTSYKELTILAVRHGKVVGDLYEGLKADTFAFDVIVDKKEQGKGIGTKLIDIGISDFKELPEGYTLELDVVNPILVPHLEKRGLELVRIYSGHKIYSLSRATEIN